MKEWKRGYVGDRDRDRDRALFILPNLYFFNLAVLFFPLHLSSFLSCFTTSLKTFFSSLLFSSLFLSSLHLTFLTSLLFLIICHFRDGVPASILLEALDKAKTGRLQILRAMKDSQPNMRKSVKDSAPKAKVDSRYVMSFPSVFHSLHLSLLLSLPLYISLSTLVS